VAHDPARALADRDQLGVPERLDACGIGVQHREHPAGELAARGVARVRGREESARDGWVVQRPDRGFDPDLLGLFRMLQVQAGEGVSQPFERLRPLALLQQGDREPACGQRSVQRVAADRLGGEAPPETAQGGGVRLQGRAAHAGVQGTHRVHRFRVVFDLFEPSASLRVSVIGQHGRVPGSRVQSLRCAWGQGGERGREALELHRLEVHATLEREGQDGGASSDGIGHLGEQHLHRRFPGRREVEVDPRDQPGE
jgi:hypothetical protein